MQVHQMPFNATTMNETLAKAVESAQMNEHIRSLVLWMFQLGLTAPIIAIPFFISRIQTTPDHHFDTIEMGVIRSPETNPELASLMDAIKSNLDLNLTGWGMFKINKELVVAFISSVITFSVLFMQLTQA